ncbi:hypothetical protein [Pseudomonas bohemica]|uniref:hypothetical protein n=1 Tax=Pseudomonas bohemica TaxID=2044872 RepID=UPI000DA6118A|nr:hypothetical protein [Pseudomonas bohemica]
MTLQLTKDGIFLSLIESPTLNEREVYIDFGSLKTSVHPDTGRRRTRFVRNASAIVKGKMDTDFNTVYYDQDINLDGALDDMDANILKDVANAFVKIKTS